MSSAHIRFGDLDVTAELVGTDGGTTTFLLPCRTDPTTLFLLLHERVERRVSTPATGADWGELTQVELPVWPGDGGQASIRCEARLPSSR